MDSQLHRLTRLNIDSKVDVKCYRLHLNPLQMITSSTMMVDKENIRWTAKSVEVSWKASKNGIEVCCRCDLNVSLSSGTWTFDFNQAERAMAEFFASLSSSVQEFDRNLSRRQDWNAHSKESNPLKDLFGSFDECMQKLSVLCNSFLSAIKRRIEPLIAQTINALEQQNMTSQRLINECNNEFNKLEEKLAKSVIECRRLETQVKESLIDVDNDVNEIWTSLFTEHAHGLFMNRLTI